MNGYQAGVCKKHSTVDNIFVLHVLAEYYITSEEPNYFVLL